MSKSVKKVSKAPKGSKAKVQYSEVVYRVIHASAANIKRWSGTVERNKGSIRDVLIEAYAAGLANGDSRKACGLAVAAGLGVPTLADLPPVQTAWQNIARGLIKPEKVAPAVLAAKGVTKPTKAQTAEAVQLAGQGLRSQNRSAKVKAGASKAKVKGAVNCKIQFPKDATAADVVSAFHQWVKRHKAQGREAMEMLATWQEMSEALQRIAA